MPRTKPETRNQRSNTSPVEQPLAVQSNRKSRFRGFRIGLTGLNGAITTTTKAPSQQNFTIAKKPSLDKNHILNESVSVNESSSWAKWSHGDSRSATANENVNSSKKTSNSNRIASPRRRPSASTKNSSGNIDNSRYILAVNQGRRFVKPDSPKQIPLPQKVETGPHAATTPNKIINQEQILLIKSREDIETVHHEANRTPLKLFQQHSAHTIETQPVHYNNNNLPSGNNITEYEYYQQRSANGGRLGIEERIDVFEPNIVSQQTFIGDDELESIQLRQGHRQYDDDDTTTACATETSTIEALTPFNIISQSPIQPILVLEPLQSRMTNVRECSYQQIENMNEPLQHSSLPMENATSVPPLATRNHFSGCTQHNDRANHSNRRAISIVQVANNAQKIQSQVHRLSGLKNSAEFLNVISSQISHQHIKNLPAAAVESATIRHSETCHSFSEIQNPSTKAPVTYTRQQDPTEAEDIDRLLAILEPITREVDSSIKVPMHQNALTYEISRKPPPLHNSPRKQHPVVNQRQQHNRELGTQYSGSTDGEFNEKLKAEAFAAFDDENDDDIVIANPYLTANNVRLQGNHSMVDSNCHHTQSEGVLTHQRSDTKRENQPDSPNGNISISRSENSVNQDSEITKQFFQSVFDSVDNELEREVSLQQQEQNPFSSPTFDENKIVMRRIHQSEKNCLATDRLLLNRHHFLPYDNSSLMTATTDVSFHMPENSRVPEGNKVLPSQSCVFIDSDRALNRKPANGTLQEQPQTSFPVFHHSYISRNPFMNNSIRDSSAGLPVGNPLNFIAHKETAIAQSHAESYMTTSNSKIGTCLPGYKKDESIKSQNIAPSPQLEKLGYASAPIRKYWQQYSNVRSGGSFDTMSLRNDGSDEQSCVEIKNRSRSKLDNAEVSTVPFTGNSDHNNTKINIQKVALTVQNESGYDGLHPKQLNVTSNQGRDSVTFIKSESNKNLRKVNSADFCNTSTRNISRLKYSSDENGTDIDNAATPVNTQNESVYDVVQPIIVNSSSIENQNSISFTKSAPNMKIRNPNSVEHSTWYHDDTHQQLRTKGQLYDDEGLSVHLSQQLFVKTVDQRGFIAKRAVSGIPVHETPTVGNAFSQDDLNSPETEFHIFTTASQLATQEFNTRVEKAISPTKGTALIRTTKSTRRSEKNDSVANDMFNGTTDLSPISKCKRYHNETQRALPSQEIYISDSPLFTKPSDVLPESKHERQQGSDVWPSVYKSDYQLENSQFDQGSHGIVHIEEEIGPIPKRFPSFDSDVAIAEDIIELLSVTSSEEIPYQDPPSLTTSDSVKKYLDNMRRSARPILPPWLNKNDNLPVTAPEDIVSVSSRQISHGGHSDRIRRKGRPQPGALDNNESVYSKDLPSPLRDTLIHAMSPMLSGDSHDEDTVSEWSSRYDQSKAGYSESFHQQCCSILDCFDLVALEEQLRTICSYKRD